MIDPVFLQIGNLQIRYYGLIYAVMFTIGLFMIIKISEYKKNKLKIKSYQKFTKDLIYDYMIYLIIGSIFTARLFHIIFYNLEYYLTNPLLFFAFWKGGMSIHGGFVGGIIATIIFSKKNKINFYDIADIVMIPCAIGLSIGRIGNFINQELVGTLTNLPWGVKFDNYEGIRHPSQIYESIKNLIIFIFLLFLNKKEQKKGIIFWSFILSYGILRFLVEFVKDMPIIFLNLKMGQLLSIPMIIISIYMLYKIKKEK